MQQLNLISQTGISQTTWCSDDWETPPELAEKIEELLKPGEDYILEPCAGTGSLAKTLARLSYVTAFEISQTRFSQLEKIQSDFLKVQHCDFLKVPSEQHYDVVVANFPFSQIVSFIDHSMKFLKPYGRLLMLAPLDCFCAKKRNADFLKLNLHIHAIHPIVGRVAYLKNGQPEKNRQIYDAVFDIRSYQKHGDVNSFLKLE